MNSSETKAFEHKREIGDVIYKVFAVIFVAVQAGAVVSFYIQDRLVGAKSIIYAVLYVFLAYICMQWLDVSGTIIWRTLFLIVKILLARRVFADSVGSVVICVVIMTVANFLFKSILKLIIKNFHLSERKPMGMG